MGRQFYDSQAPGIGTYFVESLLSDMESLILYAGIHQRCFGFHRMLSKRFPFAIYYDLEGDIACVYGILDMRRNPAWIRDRLRARTTPDSE